MTTSSSALLPDAIVPRFATSGVGALMSTRAGGVSKGGFDSLNLGSAVGDDPGAVAENRARFAAALQGARPVFLQQVHGLELRRLDATAAGHGAMPCADASLSTEPGIACVIQVADCLPVLMAAPDRRGVAAAHAGWRGLAGGVLEATLAALVEAAACSAADVEVWLGPCIGPRQFEVGADVLAGFGVDPAAAHPRFLPAAPGKWLADLAGLAGDRLRAQGARQIGGGGWCTVEDASRFFSYRRDRPRYGNSGRMAAAIWIDRV
jgi:YfiH family protein